MKTSEAGLAFISAHEGTVLRAYDDFRPGYLLKPGDAVKGTLTIGVGHTGPDVFIGQTITQAQALELLKKDLAGAEADVERFVTAKVTQNQFDALVSFVFNVGGTNFRKSTLLRRLNSGDVAGAAQQFMVWNKSKGQVLPGLTKRRAAEADLFLKG